MGRELKRFTRRLFLLQVLKTKAHWLVAACLACACILLVLLPTGLLHAEIKVDENALTGHSRLEYSLLHVNMVDKLTKNKTLTFEGLGMRSFVHNESIYAIFQAPRSPGAECLLISTIQTQYNAAQMFVLAKFWRGYSYWAKDILFLVAPDTASIQNFVKDYNTDIIGMAKCGELQNAVHFDVLPASDLFSFEFYGKNGQSANLDLIATFISVFRDRGLNVLIHGMSSHQSSSMSPYKENIKRLLHVLKIQATEACTGPHQYFKDIGVDAITILGTQSSFNRNEKVLKQLFGMSMEAGFVTINNLIERLHHSTFFYLATSQFDYIPLLHYFLILILLNGSFMLSALYFWMTIDGADSSLKNVFLFFSARSLTERNIYHPMLLLTSLLPLGYTLYILPLSVRLFVALVTSISMTYYNSSLPITACIGQCFTAAITLSFGAVNYSISLFFSVIFLIWHLICVNLYLNSFQTRKFIWVLLVLCHPVSLQIVCLYLHAQNNANLFLWTIYFPVHSLWTALNKCT